MTKTPCNKDKCLYKRHCKLFDRIINDVSKDYGKKSIERCHKYKQNY